MIFKENQDYSRGYTKICSEVFRSGSLPLAALGLYCLINSLPRTWNLSVPGLAALVPDGPEKIRLTLKELKDAGYLQIKQSRNEGQRFSRNECVVVLSPSVDSSYGDNR